VHRANDEAQAQQLDGSSELLVEPSELVPFSKEHRRAGWVNGFRPMLLGFGGKVRYLGGEMDGFRTQEEHRSCVKKD
jgi:hypothetical protein